MARTPLFAALRRAVRLARLANRPASPSVTDILDLERAQRASRRQFLRSTAAGVAALHGGGLIAEAGQPWDSRHRPRQPRIAIVGGGMAGLNAAYSLKKAGLQSTIYDAATRVGGRIFTADGIMGHRLTTELGGEFIDSTHEDMLALVDEFGLDLIDTEAPSESGLVREAYFFNGQFYSEAEVIDAFRPIAELMQADYDALGEIVDFEDDGGATELDHTSISQYLDNLGVTGFLRQLLDVAYVTEYGLEADRQSSLNLLFLIGLDTSDDLFRIFGDSDEWYKIRGGNERIIDELSRRLRRDIELGHRLESVRRRGQGYRLNFAVSGRRSIEVDADVVILAIPFTLLRDVELRVELFPAKRRAIRELGYGTNAKVMVGLRDRLWRDQGYSGNVFSDEAFQLAWDNSRQQPGSAGGLTLYSGGQAGVDVGHGTARFQAARLMPGVDRIFPGALAAQNGRVHRFHWPSFPLTRGSYACYLPGQWTTIAGAEFREVDNLFFAGEHCSYDYQGYMNGAAETGRRAAENVLAAVGVR